MNRKRSALQKWGLPAVLLGLAVTIYGQVDPYLQGRACMEREQYDSAVFYLERALKLQPGETEIFFQLGVSYYNLDRAGDAHRSFYEVEKRRKGMGSLYLARLEARLNHPEQAMKYLRIHLSSRYKVPEKEILLDKDLSRLDNQPGWKNFWIEKRWYTQQDNDFQEAMFLKQNGDALEAINMLNKLEKQGYNRSLVQEEKASIYSSLGNMKAARSSIRDAARSDVRNLDALQKLASYQLQEGEYQEAITGLNRIISQDPARFHAYLLRAEAKSALKDLEGARKDLGLYLAYFPTDDNAHYRKGMIEFSHGKYLNAIQSFNRALELNGGVAAYYFARGRTYASTGTTRYADRDMSMALDLDPYSGETWFEKGKLSEKLGDRQSACHCYKKALQFGVSEALELIDNQCR